MLRQAILAGETVEICRQEELPPPSNITRPPRSARRLFPLQVVRPIRQAKIAVHRQLLTSNYFAKLSIRVAVFAWGDLLAGTLLLDT